MVFLIPLSHLLCTGIEEISEDVYKGVEHSDSEDSDKSDSSDSEYASDEEQKPKSRQDTEAGDKEAKDPSKRGPKDQLCPSQDKEGKTEGPTVSMGDVGTPVTLSEPLSKEKQGVGSDKEPPEKAKTAPPSLAPKEKPQVKEQVRQPPPVEDSDSERELVIDLGEDQGGRERKRSRKEPISAKDPPASKTESELSCPLPV